MGRKLDAPKEKPVTNQVISQWLVSWVRNDDADKTVKTDETVLRYTVLDLHDDGTERSREEVSIIMDDWDAPLNALIKNLHNRLEFEADALGLFEAGTDSDDL